MLCRTLEGQLGISVSPQMGHASWAEIQGLII
ncbi:MAG: hypothetical protein ACI9LT_000886, partial [Pseudoalteromonas distincta]